VAHQRVLELLGRDPLAAALDEVGDPIRELDEAVLVDARDVAGAEPAVVGPLVGRRVAGVAGRDPRPADLELAVRAIVGRDVAVRVPDAQVDQRRRQPLLGAQLVARSARDRISSIVNGTSIIVGAVIGLPPGSNLAGTPDGCDGTPGRRDSVRGSMRAIILWTLLLGLAACGDNLGSDRPEISGASLTTDEDVPISHDVEASEPAGRALGLSAQPPMHGTVAIDRLRVTYTPSANYHGPDAFTVTVSNGTFQASARIEVTVRPVNDAPVAADDTATTLEDTPLVLSPAALLANDADVDGPALAITAVQNAVNGSADLGATAITFTPDAGFTGTASFDYVVGDGTDSDVGTVTITVVKIPVCGDGTVTTPETCDDGDVIAGDGCSAACATETGWTCTGQPSVCTTICGDDILAGAEACDDGNTSDGDGCSATCQIELISIAITPGPIAIGQQQRVQLTATGTYFDGTTVDLTAAAAWATTDPAVAIVGTGGADDGRVDSLTTAGTATISATVGAITGTTVVDVGAATCSVRINEIQVHGDGAAASADELAELVNPCTFAIDVTGWTLVYRSAAGTSDAAVTTVTLTGTMAPGSFRLYVGTGYNGGGTPDGVIGTNATGSYASAGGGVAVRSGPQNTGPIVDSIAWGTATNAFIEGTVAPAPPANRSLGRSPFDGKDRNVNSADFVLTDPAATPPTLPTPGTTNFP
jgi:cysteine-rich repeat protein